MKIPHFENKKDLFKWLVDKKTELIELKKATFKCADNVLFSQIKENETTKALFTSNKDEVGKLNRTIIGNTYNWLDSHGDVHVGNTFKKSIEERTNKIFHLHDHKHEITAKVGKFSNVYEKQVNWRDIGVDIDGVTTVLMADSEILEKYNKGVFDLYKDGEIDQHSVGMVYVKIKLAVQDSDYKEEKEAWDSYFPLIGNKEKAESRGYFWVVQEAKLIEISAVLMASNEITNTVENIEPSIDTQKNEEKQAEKLHLENSKIEMLKSLI